MSKLRPESEVLADNNSLELGGLDDIKTWLLDELYAAFAAARKGKLGTVNEQRFEEDRDINLSKLADDIIARVYRPQRSVAFIITAPTPREIFAASFRDRIVHHFLVRQVGNFWDKRFSPRSFSCREGKGTLYGVRCLERDIARVDNGGMKPAWVMKIDLQGYFMSLSREYLFTRACWGLGRQFPNGGPVYDMCRYLWSKIVFDNPLDEVSIKGLVSDWDILPPSKSMFNSPEGCGIVIGNLTSQWLSNIALDPLDRYVRIELGCKYYGRYVDDAYFIANTKEELLGLRLKVEAFIHGLGLTVHPKKFYLQPLDKGVSFLGVVAYPGRTVLGKRFRRNMKLLSRRIDAKGLTDGNINSLTVYKGLAKHYKYKQLSISIFGNELG